MDKKINISIDIDGTLNSSDTSKSFFQIITHLLHPDPYVNITILTSREAGTESKIRNELDEMSILYDKIVISDNKQDYISDNDISVVFENEDESFLELGEEVTVFKIREEFNFSFSAKKWIGSKKTTKMID